MARSERASTRGAWFMAAGTATLLAGCPVLAGEAERLGDGERCSEDEECRSGTCTSSELCAHSSCECGGTTCEPPGEPARQCADGWVCSDEKGLFDGVQEFFGGTPREDKGYCHPLCSAGCPEHYACQGELCVPDVSWNEPVPSVTWSGALSGKVEGKNAMQTLQLEVGQKVKLRATASSPTNREITSYSWMYLGGGFETIQGPELEFALRPEDAWQQVNLYVGDDHAKSALITFYFEACLGQGETCGYDGSGCCHGCDQQANLCQ
jgi:hypothetical protein